jgi:hypothetical protein
MGFITLGALALLALIWLGRGGDVVLKQRGWRITSGAFALAALAGAALLAFRDAFVPAGALLLLSLWLAVAARRNSAQPPPPPKPRRSSRMSLDEARSILGVGEDATAAEVRAAHKRLMRMAHPDKGGTTGLASQLNAARERLLSELEGE